MTHKTQQASSEYGIYICNGYKVANKLFRAKSTKRFARVSSSRYFIVSNSRTFDQIFENYFYPLCAFRNRIMLFGEVIVRVFHYQKNFLRNFLISRYFSNIWKLIFYVTYFLINMLFYAKNFILSQKKFSTPISIQFVRPKYRPNLFDSNFDPIFSTPIWTNFFDPIFSTPILSTPNFSTLISATISIPMFSATNGFDPKFFDPNFHLIVFDPNVLDPIFFDF